MMVHIYEAAIIFAVVRAVVDVLRVLMAMGRESMRTGQL
jgi:hypothetical protein